MIIRKDRAPADRESEGQESLRYSDAGGLTQYGAYVQTLQPGAAVFRPALARRGGRVPLRLSAR